MGRRNNLVLGRHNPRYRPAYTQYDMGSLQRTQTPTSSKPHPDRIASAVLAAFSSLPLKSKPRTRPDNSREWVTLAGIVLEHGTMMHPIIISGLLTIT